MLASGGKSRATSSLSITFGASLAIGHLLPNTTLLEVTSRARAIGHVRICYPWWSDHSKSLAHHELQTFEKELSIHAKIEDELLFPKAVELEKEALRKIRKQIQTN